jgi:hypothetical protein
MDGPGGIVVEFKESEAFALLLGAAMLRGISKLQPEMIDAMVVQLVPQLRAGAFERWPHAVGQLFGFLRW